MAIVKMSKIRVIGLLEDKNKVYDFLQNNQMVHIAPTPDYENTKSLSIDQNVSKMIEEKERLDKCIEFITKSFNFNKEPILLTSDQIIEKDIELEKDRKLIFDCVEKIESVKAKIDENEKNIEKNKEIVAKLLTNSNKMISELVKTKKLLIEYQEDCQAIQLVDVYRAKNDLIAKENQDLLENITSEKDCLESLKLMSDKYARDIQKIEGDELLRCTDRTFIMEFYLPTEKESGIVEDLQKLSPTIYSEKLKVEKSDQAPTLARNNKVFEQAEFVTNMYSIPAHHEVDPNPLVFVFFMLFFGYIMADYGLGLAMMIIGYVVSAKLPEGGAKKLWKVVGTAGIFAMFWGVLYNSCCGFQILPFTIMPDPNEKAILTLLFCLLLGVVHLAFGYAMKGVNAIHEGRILDSILDGFLWDGFFLGGIMAATKFLLNFFKLMDFTQDTPIVRFLSDIQMPGVIMLLVSLGIITLLSGRKAKGFGKIIKPFTTLYGLINIFSDILSYARLFGLMLSGAIISQQFDNIGVSLMGKNVIGTILGIIVIIIGNAFNLAMGALGAYIHDCRLQYIEYFGKFYTGEGTLFKPFTPKYKYIEIKQN